MSSGKLLWCHKSLAITAGACPEAQALPMPAAISGRSTASTPRERTVLSLLVWPSRIWTARRFPIALGGERENLTSARLTDARGFTTVTFEEHADQHEGRDRRCRQCGYRPPVDPLRSGLARHHDRQCLCVEAGQQRCEKYSFQQRTTERMKAATIPGSAIGRTIQRNAPQIEQPSTSAACSISVGIVSN